MKIQKKIYFALVVIVLLNFACNNESQNASENQNQQIISIIEEENYKGAIFSKKATEFKVSIEFDGRFTPSEQDIADGENLIVNELNNVEKHLIKLTPFSVEYIMNNLIYYDRQYIGLVNSKGEKILFINFVMNYQKKSGIRTGPYFKWDNHFVEVNDGGADFWRLYINLNREVFERWEINGSA